MVTTPFPFTQGWIDLDRMMTRVVRDTLEPARAYWSANGSSAQPMPLDLFATDDAAVVLAALPGVRPDDLELSVHQNTVTITGKVLSAIDSEEAKGATWYSRELWGGEFRRSFTLPFAVDADKVDAQLRDGILKVTLPKAEHAKPRRIAIGIGSNSATAVSDSKAPELAEPTT